MRFVLLLSSGALLAMSCNAPFSNDKRPSPGNIVQSDSTSPPSVASHGKIAFFSNRSGIYHLYLVNPDGSDQTQLTCDDSRFELDGYPSWSPDGNRIAYNSFESDPDGGRQKIYVIGVDGSNETCLTNDSDGYAPSWSPDGNKILFLSDRDSDRNKSIFISELYLMNADGMGQTRAYIF